MTRFFLRSQVYVKCFSEKKNIVIFKSHHSITTYIKQVANEGRKLHDFHQIEVER